MKVRVFLALFFLHCQFRLLVGILSIVAIFFRSNFIGSNEAGNEAIAEPIETSVVSLDSEMIIVQPAEINPADNESNSNSNEPQIDVEIRVESSHESDVAPSPKRRKRCEKEAFSEMEFITTQITRSSCVLLLNGH